MFCDEIIARAETMHSNLVKAKKSESEMFQIKYVLQAIQHDFDKMQKVKLTDGFAEFLPRMDVKEQFPYLQKVLPLVRLMYPQLWLEITEAGSSRGIFLHQIEDNIIEALVVFKFKNAHNTGLDGFNYAVLRFDPNSMIIDKEKGLSFGDLAHDTLPSNKNALDDGWYEQEAALIIDYLARFNSPTIVEYTDVDMTMLNKKRAKNNKLPLSNHRIVDLSKVIKKALNSKEGDGEPGSQKRMHWVRGHFKVRKTGMFWWNPHLSAIPKNEDAEFVNKEYVA